MPQMRIQTRPELQIKAHNRISENSSSEASVKRCLSDHQRRKQRDHYHTCRGSQVWLLQGLLGETSYNCIYAQSAGTLSSMSDCSMKFALCLPSYVELMRIGTIDQDQANRTGYNSD